MQEEHTPRTRQHTEFLRKFGLGTPSPERPGHLPIDQDDPPVLLSSQVSSVQEVASSVNEENEPDDGPQEQKTKVLKSWWDHGNCTLKFMLEVEGKIIEEVAILKEGSSGFAVASCPKFGLRDLQTEVANLRLEMRAEPSSHQTPKAKAKAKSRAKAQANTKAKAQARSKAKAKAKSKSKAPAKPKPLKRLVAIEDDMPEEEVPKAKKKKKRNTSAKNSQIADVETLEMNAVIENKEVEGKGKEVQAAMVWELRLVFAKDQSYVCAIVGGKKPLLAAFGKKVNHKECLEELVRRLSVKMTSQTTCTYDSQVEFHILKSDVLKIRDAILSEQ